MQDLLGLVSWLEWYFHCIKFMLVRSSFYILHIHNLHSMKAYILHTCKKSIENSTQVLNPSHVSARPHMFCSWKPAILPVEYYHPILLIFLYLNIFKLTHWVAEICDLARATLIETAYSTTETTSSSHRPTCFSWYGEKHHSVDHWPKTFVMTLEALHLPSYDVRSRWLSNNNF